MTGYLLFLLFVFRCLCSGCGLASQQIFLWEVDGSGAGVTEDGRHEQENADSADVHSGDDEELAEGGKICCDASGKPYSGEGGNGFEKDSDKCEVWVTEGNASSHDDHADGRGDDDGDGFKDAREWDLPLVTVDFFFAA